MECIHNILFIVGIVVAVCDSAYMMKIDEQSAYRAIPHRESEVNIRLGPIERVETDHLGRSNPTYDHLGVGFRWRARRDLESATPRETFELIDRSRDSFIDVCEWTAEGGSPSNFMELLRDDDMNGDEKISFEEFPKWNVHVVAKTRSRESD